MKVVELSLRKLKSMPLLQLSNQIVNTEGRLYLYNHKDKWNYLKELIKIYYNQSDRYLADKMYIISELLVNRESIGMDELILPTSLISLDGNISGFSMPFIENNINMSLFLNNPKINIEQKIKYLKEIYMILEKSMSIKALEGKFFLGDIHEANFVLDIMEQKIKAIDMDSAYINDSTVSISKFLTCNANLEENFSKYPKDENGNPIPNRNTTILSFIYMLLNVLSGEKTSYRWTLDEYYKYLSYLSSKKVPLELLDALANVYTNSEENNFEIEMLDEIDVRNNYTLKKSK